MMKKLGDFVLPEQIFVGDYASPDKLVDRLLAESKAHPGQVIGGSCGVWSLCFSSGGVDGMGSVFSARVLRSTKERDWRILGQMAARIGAPEEATPESIRTNAEATHYWIWNQALPHDEAVAIANGSRAKFERLMQAKGSN